MYSLGPLGSGCPFPALPGLPGSLTDLFLRAVPNHPGRSGGCLLIASPPITGFITFGRLATSILAHEAESGSLALRLAGLLPRFPPDGLRRLAPGQLHVRMSNLHGELLSVHKIKPGLTWYSESRKRTEINGSVFYRRPQAQFPQLNHPQLHRPDPSPVRRRKSPL
jgi:hypothetical protein